MAALLLFGTMVVNLCGCSSHFPIPPNDPLYAEQTNLAAIHMEAAWKEGLTGRGVKIAVIDTGVSKHQDLDFSHISGKSYVDKDAADLTDIRGHGTFIAGMLVAVQNNGKGIAGMTQSDLVVLKIWGSSAHVSADDMAQAIRDAVDVYGCSVINISMGTPNGSDKLRQAVDYAVGRGAIIVAAAGGDSQTPYYPAACDSVIGVDAVDENGNVPDTAVKNDSVFVTAPGAKIISLDFNGGYERNGAGASYAAVQVTALAAFAKQEKKNMTAGEFKTLLKDTVTDRGEKGYDSGYGWGVVNAASFTARLKQI